MKHAEWRQQGNFALNEETRGKGLFPHQTQRVTRRMRSKRTRVNPGRIRKGAGPRKPREIETERAGKGEIIRPLCPLSIHPSIRPTTLLALCAQLTYPGPTLDLSMI